MKYLIAVCLFLCGSVAIACGSFYVSVGVARVTDGDGLFIDNEEVRLYGVDAPSLSSYYGPEAKMRLQDLVEGSTITALCMGGSHIDGRPACRIIIENRDVNLQLIEEGMVTATDEGFPIYRAAQGFATDFGHGMWQ